LRRSRTKTGRSFNPRPRSTICAMPTRAP
jgi:hypothetical protein